MVTDRKGETSYDEQHTKSQELRKELAATVSSVYSSWKSWQLGVCALSKSML